MGMSELLPITKELYNQMTQIAWLMLAPMFLLSCVIEYMKEPHNFPALQLLKNLVLAIFLLCTFPEISQLISNISNELANKIGDHGALGALFDQIRAEAAPKSQLSKFPFLLTSDMYVQFLNYLSYSFVFLCKFLMIALYHFFWSLLLTLAPLAIICTVFRSCTHVTGHLFSSLLEISMWNVVWQILGQMLLGLQIVQQPSNYFDAVCFNFFLGLGMIGTPILVHTLVKEGLTSASVIAPSIAAATVIKPMKVAKSVHSSVTGRRK